MCKTVTLILILLSTTSPSMASQFFYKYDDQGRLHVAKTRLESNYLALYPVETKITLASSAERARWRDSLRSTVQEVAKRFGIDHVLLDALILVESGYDPNAVSLKGAVGLTQLMPGTAAALGVSDPRDPRQNLMGGAAHLARLLQQFDKLDLALAAYNAGEGAVRRAKGVPNYPETIKYVRSIKSLYERAGKP